MSATTTELVNYLRACDTAGILKILDSSVAHTNKTNSRAFIRGSILIDCIFFNKIIDKYGMPDINKIIFRKDSSRIREANIIILPLPDKPDTSLNIKRCFLVLVFYPDEYFQYYSHLLRYTISKEELKLIDRDKIEMPNWLKDINKSKQIPPDVLDKKHD